MPPGDPSPAPDPTIDPPDDHPGPTILDVAARFAAVAARLYATPPQDGPPADGAPPDGDPVCDEPTLIRLDAEADALTRHLLALTPRTLAELAAKLDVLCTRLTGEHTPHAPHPRLTYALAETIRADVRAMVGEGDERP